MIFKKPYAFFIKYFKVINFLLTILLSILVYKLSLLHNVINSIYFGTFTNYSNLSSSYIGFPMYLLLIFITIILLLIVLLLKNKNKPFRDYALLILYFVILVIYLLSVDNVFYVLIDGIVEQSKLDLYCDISILIILPLIYFIINYLLISIGFNLKKFNFTKDVVELKAEESDSEEIELIFDKDSYKYKRKVRKGIREFKYYLLENKFFVMIFVFVFVGVIFSTLLGIKIFDKNNVRLKETFISNSISYTVNNLYETKYDISNSEIKKGYKYVIANISVKNMKQENIKINYEHIRLLYGDEYVYANNYFNNYFNDLGKPYNNELLKTNENNNFIFIFQVPTSYKSNSYKMKFYSGIFYEEDDINGVYKTINVKAEKLDNKVVNKKFMLGENTVFNKKLYKNSNITIREYKTMNTFTSSNSGELFIIKPLSYNDILLVIEYELLLDDNSYIKDIFDKRSQFFDKFMKIEYILNGNIKSIDKINVVNADAENKIFISVPYDIKSAEKIDLIFNFRNLKINYNIK